MVVAPPPTPSGSRSWQPPVWLPWLTAPAFFLLPIGGCGIAAAARRPATPSTAAAIEPLPGPAPVATMVTVVTPHR